MRCDVRWKSGENLYFLTLKRLEVNLTPHGGFFKNVIFRVFEALFFVAFNNIVISHIFPESFIEIPQVIQKIWFSSPILTIFINISDFLILTFYKETNDVSIKQMTSGFFYLHPILNRLFDNCVKLHSY